MAIVRDSVFALAMTILSMSWLLAGLVLNVAQLTAFLLLRPLSLNFYRHVIYLLTYCMWSPLVAIAEHGAGFSIRVWFADEQSQRHFGHEHMIAIANHTYEVDWLILWLLLDKYGVLASAKAMAKKVIRFFPVIGWAYYFNEFIFLERQLEKDKETLCRGLDNFLTVERPLTVLMFCEGTRFTAAKYEAAKKFAASKGIEPYTHHLIPRSRGFVCCIKHLKENPDATSKMPALYNVQIAISSDQPDANFHSLMHGLPVRGDVYLERIPIADIPDGGEEKFLMQLYRRKDELMSHHAKHGRFPDSAGICIQPVPRLLPLLHLIFWCGSMTSAVAYLLIASATSGQTILFWSIAGLLIAVFIGFRFLMRSTQATRGSSYGSTAPST